MKHPPTSPPPPCGPSRPGSWFAVALLAAIRYGIGRSLRATGLRLVLEITVPPTMGLLMIVLKTQLH